MKCPKTMISFWALVVALALSGVAQAEAQHNMPPITSFEALQQHFDQAEGHFRLMLFVDPG